MGGKTIPHKRQRWADFCLIFARCNYEGFSLFRFCGFTELLPKLFSESSLPMSRIFEKTTILYKLQRWADFCQISARYNYAEFPLFQFYVFTELSPKLFFWIITPRRVASLEKRQFCTSANGGSISASFSPAEITRPFRFPILRFYGTFAKAIFLNHHFR